MLAVGSLVLTAYVLLQIVWIGLLGETLEVLDNVNDSLGPWPMVMLAILALVGAWGTGLLVTWGLARLLPRRPGVTGGVGGLLGLAAGALILRAVGLV